MLCLQVQEACKQTLQEFGCIDYLDMYLVHWPVGNNKPDDPPLEVHLQLAHLANIWVNRQQQCSVHLWLTNLGFHCAY